MRTPVYNQGVLSIQNLSMAYGAAPVFANASLQADPGDFIAIIGDSGVGKSTFLNILAGLDEPTSGNVSFNGSNITALSSEERTLFRRAQVGFVFQAFHVLPHLTVAQNVAVPLLLNGREDARAVSAQLASVGLSGFESRLPQTLSGGQLQRVAIARALIHSPALVLADEPTGNLDPTTGAAVLDVLFERMRATKAITLLVTHSEAAAARATRVLRLSANGLHPA
jgi:putative ABC transport system ATP-binding protein